MKAIRFESYGSPSVLTMKEIPMPVLQKGEVLIQIKAAAINPSDVKIVAGIIKASLPRVPGRDYAGVVVDGEAKKGMEVWGSGAGFGVTRDGCHAEYLAVPAGWISQKPTNLTMEQAAAIGVPYVTAWCTLVLAGNIQAGETVLIIGVSGAVGQAATQIAHWKKAHVIGASTSSENPSGADAIINITILHLEEEVRKLTQGKGVDLVLDAVGGSMFEHGLKALRRGGRQIAITTTKDRKVSFDLLEFYHNQLHLIGVDTMKLSGTETADLLQNLRFGFQEGYLQAPAVTTWPLERALEAYMAVEKGGSLTKQVLIPHADSRRMV